MPLDTTRKQLDARGSEDNHDGQSQLWASPARGSLTQIEVKHTQRTD